MIEAVENKEGKQKESIYTKLCDKVIAVLNRQVKHELENSSLYLAMEMFCLDKQYKGAAKLFSKQSLEERDHAKIFANYLLDKGNSVAVPALDKFDCTGYTDLIECLFASLRREKGTTDMIKQIASISLEEKDYQTYELALMMLKEQVHEEATFIDILARWKILEGCANGLFLLDQELGNL